MKKRRIEKDALGEISLPPTAYYGAQTMRAVNNFPISGLKPLPAFLRATVMIKKAAATVNERLGLLPKGHARAIIRTCDEILVGKWDDQFVVDPYQAGAGTSHNMNVNEVIANRANEILGSPLGTYTPLHPNDHVNMSQSTNDVVPTAIRLAILMLLPDLLAYVKKLQVTFEKKSKEFKAIKKPGRTHLQDALPVTLGQEFSAYAKALEKDGQRIKHASSALLSLGIGGTAVGTGANSHPDYHKLMVVELAKLTQLPLASSDNLFEYLQNTADFLDISAQLRTLSQTLIRIGNDLRLLGSGPGTGLAEIILPTVQPGSSIMPGKVNPSIVEMLTMVCFQVIGLDQAVLLASQAGQLELNVMFPLIAYNIETQMRLLTNAIRVFNDKCVAGITANPEMCAFWLGRSSGMGALLNPYIGYAKAAEVVKESVATGRSLEDILLEKKLLSRKELKKIFK